MERAARSGEILATGRITLPGETGNQFGFIVFAPVYRKGALTNTDQARRDNLEGFMLSVFRINDIVEEATGSLKPEGVDFSIDDASASEEERFLYSHESRLRKTPLVKKEQSEAGYRKTKTLEVRRAAMDDKLFGIAGLYRGKKGQFAPLGITPCGFCGYRPCCGFPVFQWQTCRTNRKIRQRSIECQCNAHAGDDGAPACG